MTDKNKQELQLPEIMQDTEKIGNIVKDLKQDMNRSTKNIDYSKYLVMEGMQNLEKVPFFTEFVDDDDVLRMNTIEMFVKVAPFIIRKTSKNNFIKIDTLLKEVYVSHVNSHKTNMVSKNRKREESYTKILSSDSSDSGVVPTGLQKFFGIGGKKN